MVAEPNIATGLSHGDPVAPVIFGVTLILIAALIGRYTARQLKQPSVLGELVMGVVLGNLLHFAGFELMSVLREGVGCTELSGLVMSGLSLEQAVQQLVGPEYAAGFLQVVSGPHGREYLSVAQAVDVFSRYGVIFLLFHIGLDTCVAQLQRVGGDSLRVALIGVLAPFALGFLVTWWLTPDAPHTQHMFLGATLGATSIGITARVLQDLGQSRSGVAQVVVGAAVMDDVLGLVMLAIVSGIVVTGSIELDEILRIILLASLFIASVLLLGPHIIRALIRLLRHMEVVEAKLFIPFVFVMTLAWLANLVGLATIVGAFAAGLLMLDSHFQAWGDYRKHKYSIKELFAPLEAILVPIFFVLMGIQVKLESFLDPQVLLLSAGLTLVAVLGKLVAGLGVMGADRRRLAVGIGMMPRGEVGLVFASIGISLNVIDKAMFSAVLMMVMVTTLATPPLLKWALGDSTEGKGPDRSVGKQCQ
ncbi:cation:proton antiporter [Candidatus Endoriftia persephone]|jgi:Kef-type K+ transport system membrane component KefB|nr:cation:proton antiporter [Candidatus Endoriftia persephone]USF88495.1 cation:proton antiporter [Candidatus Endoriftia persephone]